MHRYYIAINDYQVNKDKNYTQKGQEPDKSQLGQDKSQLGQDKAQLGQDKAQLRQDKAQLGLSPRLNQIKEKCIHSPQTMRRNISKDNFMKYQWAWTL